MEKTEILSFTYQERYLSRFLIQSRKHLILYIKHLAKKHKIPAEKIIFNHDLDFQENSFKFIDNFKVNGSYDYIKEELKK